MILQFSWRQEILTKGFHMNPQWTRQPKLSFILEGYGATIRFVDEEGLYSELIFDADEQRWPYEKATMPGFKRMN
jgi:hypothetical protein